MKTRSLSFSLAGFIIIIDQLTKVWVSQARVNLHVIPNFFTIHYIENRGAAFGILQGQRIFLILVSLLAAGILSSLILLERENRRMLLFAVALILGGTIGNLLDRIRLHYVIDFLQFYVKLFGRYWYWPSFNIADSAITVGVGLLILFTFRQESHPKSEKQSIQP